MVGLLAIGAAVVAVAVVWLVRSMPSPVTIDAATAPARVAISPAAAPSPATPSGPIVVDVAGRVRHPGVYTFQQGDRVVDAIRRAGGALSGSDLTSLNLAALLTDAEQVVVGKAGGLGTTSGTSTGSSSGATGTGGTAAKVNVNTATLDQLEALPGIGPVLAQRIIDYREQHGPFGSVQDLLNVSGIGDAHLADLEPLVTVS